MATLTADEHCQRCWLRVWCHVVKCCSNEKVGTRTLQLASFLQGRGISAMCYHSGLSATQRQAVSDNMVQRLLRVVTCTTSLSTGLDMAGIDGIMHHALPSSMEEYVQQVCASLATDVQPHLRALCC
jgi:superfamily II DNA helicase RecQ